MANNILEAIEREYKSIRENNQKSAQKCILKARENKEFCENENRLKTLNFEIAKAEQFDEDFDKATALKAIRENIIEEQNIILHKLGLTLSDFQVKYTCDICKDTGFSNGKPCKCFNEKWKRYTFESLGLSPIPSVSFKDDTANKPVKLTKIYSSIKKYVDKFPFTNTRNFVFTGSTGCGKTFLASIVANELSQKGFNSIFLTATELNQLFLKMHLSSYNERMDYMSILINCDFLVIDDLGTENSYKNVTIECLLALISERLAKKKHTIITTNLTQNELLERYNERFFSRITEKLSTVVIDFEDYNFRTKKR